MCHQWPRTDPGDRNARPHYTDCPWWKALHRECLGCPCAGERCQGNYDCGIVPGCLPRRRQVSNSDGNEERACDQQRKTPGGNRGRGEGGVALNLLLVVPETASVGLL